MLMWGRWRPPGLIRWWSRKWRQTVPRASARRWARVRSRSPQSATRSDAVDDGGEVAAHAGPELAASVDGSGQVHGVVVLGGQAAVVDGVGRCSPPAHRHPRGVDVEPLEDREELVLDLGEALEVPGRDVGDDHVDLPGRESPERRRLANTGAVAQHDASVGESRRGHGGGAGLVAQPGLHGDRAVDVVEPGGVVVADGGRQLGVEAVPDGEQLSERVAVQWDLQVVDRVRQSTEHTFDF